MTRSKAAIDSVEPVISEQQATIAPAVTMSNENPTDQPSSENPHSDDASGQSIHSSVAGSSSYADRRSHKIKLSHPKLEGANDTLEVHVLYEKDRVFYRSTTVEDLDVPDFDSYEGSSLPFQSPNSLDFASLAIEEGDSHSWAEFYDVELRDAKILIQKLCILRWAKFFDIPCSDSYFEGRDTGNYGRALIAMCNYFRDKRAQMPADEFFRLLAPTNNRDLLRDSRAAHARVMGLIQHHKFDTGPSSLQLIKKTLGDVCCSHINDTVLRQDAEIRTMDTWWKKWQPVSSNKGDFVNPYVDLIADVAQGMYSAYTTDQFYQLLLEQSSGDPVAFCREWKNTGWPGAKRSEHEAKAMITDMLKGSGCKIDEPWIQKNFAWGRFLRFIVPDPIWKHAFAKQKPETLDDIIRMVSETAQLDMFKPSCLHKMYGILTGGGIGDIIYHPDFYPDCLEKGPTIDVPVNFISVYYSDFTVTSNEEATPVNPFDRKAFNKGLKVPAFYPRGGHPPAKNKGETGRNSDARKGRFGKGAGKFPKEKPKRSKPYDKQSAGEKPGEATTSKGTKPKSKKIDQYNFTREQNQMANVIGIQVQDLSPTRSLQTPTKPLSEPLPATREPNAGMLDDAIVATTSDVVMQDIVPNPPSSQNSKTSCSCSTGACKIDCKVKIVTELPVLTMRKTRGSLGYTVAELFSLTDIESYFDASKGYPIRDKLKAKTKDKDLPNLISKRVKLRCVKKTATLIDPGANMCTIHEELALALGLTFFKLEEPWRLSTAVGVAKTTVLTRGALVGINVFSRVAIFQVAALDSSSPPFIIGTDFLEFFGVVPTNW